MQGSVVSLPSATSTEHLEALSEVSDFSLTDMGYTGQGPWTYRNLTDASLDQELIRIPASRMLIGHKIGHVNHDTVDFVAETLPMIIKDTLRSSVTENIFVPSDHISDLLAAAIQEVDNRITFRFIDLLPRTQLHDGNLIKDSDVLSPLRDADHKTIAQSLGANLGGTPASADRYP
ncbi:hypothetical protein H0H87_007093 [Tephrocybe sp. NHM501043]|nr:hypothetical protein H0H87_007093 [Tephrocybe sp. NHM501043]